MKDIDYQQRLAVAKAAKQFRQGRINRRNVPRFARLAGFGLSSAHFLSSCRPSSQLRSPQYLTRAVNHVQ